MLRLIVALVSAVALLFGGPALAQSALPATIIGAAPYGEPSKSGGWDFSTATYSAALASSFAVTRASAANPDSSNRLWQDAPGPAITTYSAGEIRVKPGVGLILENISRSNLYPNPTAPASAEINLGTGSHVLWINAEANGRVDVSAGTAVFRVGKDGAPLPTTGTARHAAPILIRVTTAGTVNFALSGTVYSIQLEAGSSPSSFIPIQGTRAAETVAAIGTANSGLAASTGMARLHVQASRAIADGAFFVTQGNGSIIRPGYDSGFFGLNSAGGASTSTTACGNGDFRNAKLVVAWTVSTRRLVCNGGMVALGTQQWAGGGTATALGGNGFMGVIRSLDLYAAVPPVTIIRRLSELCRPALVQAGDSTSARTLDYLPLWDKPTGVLLGDRIGEILGVCVATLAAEGWTSTQLLTQYRLDGDLMSLPLVVMAGGNDAILSASSATVLANYQAMKAANTTGKLLALGYFTGWRPSEAPGQDFYNRVVGYNSALSGAFGSSFLSVFDIVNGLADPKNPLDVQLQANGQMGWTCGQPLALISRALAEDMPAGATSFVATGGFTPPAYAKIENEMVLINASSGSTATTITRALGTGGVASAHSAFTTMDLKSQTDSPHLSQYCRDGMAGPIAAKIRALGWF